jgi:hypothetical protein
MGQFLNAIGGGGNIGAPPGQNGFIGGGAMPQGTMPVGKGTLNVPAPAQQAGVQGGFGDFVRQSGVPLWMGILNAVANPRQALGQTISGYQDYKQNLKAQNLISKFDNILVNDPEVKNADWSDPSFGRNIQKLAIKRGIPGAVVDDLLDQYHISINDKGTATAMYYDIDNKNIVAHQQIEPGTIITGERYAKVDLDKAKSNPIYRNYLIRTYPGVKSWVEDAFGKAASDKQARNSFKQELEASPDAWKSMINDMGVVPFKSAYRDAYKIQFDPWPDSVSRRYDEMTEQLNTPYYDPKTGDQLDPRSRYKKDELSWYDERTKELEIQLGSGKKSSGSSGSSGEGGTSKTGTPGAGTQAGINIMNRMSDNEFMALKQRAYEELVSAGSESPTADEITNRMLTIIGQETRKRIQQR